MDNDFADLLKELLSSLAIIGAGFYIKIAKEKEPYATKNMWKILVGLGIIGIIISLLKYLI